MFQYKMVQIPPNVRVQEKEHRGNEAAAYLERVVNNMAENGWEFFRVDQVGVSISPGCLSGMLGQKETLSVFNVITFRRQTHQE